MGEIYSELWFEFKDKEDLYDIAEYATYLFFRDEFGFQLEDKRARYIGKHFIENVNEMWVEDALGVSDSWIREALENKIVDLLDRYIRFDKYKLEDFDNEKDFEYEKESIKDGGESIVLEISDEEFIAVHYNDNDRPTKIYL